MCKKRQHENRQPFSLKLRQIGVAELDGSGVTDRLPVYFECKGHPMLPCGLGLNGQYPAAWSSERQCGQRGIAFALPVKASLYRRALGVDQLRSFLASISAILVVVCHPTATFIVMGSL